MNLSKTISLVNSKFQEIELGLLLAWALLFPAKESHLYFMGFALLLAAFSLKSIRALATIALTRFSAFLLVFNAIFMASAFFSRHPEKSLFFCCDILLLSLWFSLFYIEPIDVNRYLRLVAAVISLSSLAVLVFFSLRGGQGPAAQIFKNPIMQGIASALAVLVYLQALLQKYRHADVALLLLNLLSVIVSASKAAFLGLALFAAAMILAKRRKWIAWFAAFLLLLLLVPNPLRKMVHHSLTRDPYVFSRIDIWRMSANMFRHHFWTGVGPDLFMETAKRFNFPQDRGPARFNKLPESPHSDYWKILCENGLPGLAFVLLFLLVAIRRILSPPRFDLPKLLLAFLLFQMFFVNFIFSSFFLLLFLFLLYSFFHQGREFISLTPALRVFFAVLLVFIFLFMYLSPFVSDQLLKKSRLEKNVIRRFDLLNRAALFNPLDERVPLNKAELLRGFAKARNNLEAWGSAWENLRLAQKLDRNNLDALAAESALFHDFLEKYGQYPALADEILEPLRRAEELDPFNPFLKMQQAGILRGFGRDPEARRLVLAALELEPEYVAALVFIHEPGGDPAAETAWEKRIAQIQAKAKKMRAKPGSYMFHLLQMPEKAGARQ